MGTSQRISWNEPEFRLEDTRILNRDGKLLFMMGAVRGGGPSSHSAVSELQEIMVTKLGFQALVGALNGNPGVSEQGEPLYGSSLDELRIRIASLYDENRAQRDEIASLKRQLAGVKPTRGPRWY